MFVAPLVQWFQVNYVSEKEKEKRNEKVNKGNFYGFMEHEKHGSAFFAWTDVTVGDEPPVDGAVCRATLYRQYRDNKNQWRALMLSPLDADDEPVYDHPLVVTAGKLHEKYAKKLPRKQTLLQKENLDRAVRRPSGSTDRWKSTNGQTAAQALARPASNGSANVWDRNGADVVSQKPAPPR